MLRTTPIYTYFGLLRTLGLSPGIYGVRNLIRWDEGRGHCYTALWSRSSFRYIPFPLGIPNA
jgi:hypothetical protein